MQSKDAAKTRSNSIGLFLGIVVALLILLLFALLGDYSRAQFRGVTMIAFAFVPFALAIAELRSGHAWKNLAPGNRGIERSAEPRRYWTTVASHAVLGITLIVIGCCLFAKMIGR